MKHKQFIISETFSVKLILWKFKLIFIGREPMSDKNLLGNLSNNELKWFNGIEFLCKNFRFEKKLWMVVVYITMIKKKPCHFLVSEVPVDKFLQDLREMRIDATTLEY
jgi:hypothetical protein